MVQLFSFLKKQFTLESRLGPHVPLHLGRGKFLYLEKQVKEEAAEKQ